MGINVTITAESAEELKVLLQGFSTLVQAGQITGASVTASVPDSTAGKATAGTRTRKPVETTTTDEQKADPVQQAIGTTLADVQAKLRAMSKAGHSVAVKALLDEFGVPNLSALPEDKLDEISAAADLL